jgi:cytochrome c5
MLKNIFSLVFFLVVELSSSLAYADGVAGTDNPTMITNRHHPEQFIQSIQNDPEAGKKIYQQFCSTCHAKDPSIALGAPRIGIASDWQDRMEKGIDGLLKVTIVGINQMPPRGGCFECSDAELKQAIVYMLPAEKKNK